VLKHFSTEYLNIFCCKTKKVFYSKLPLLKLRFVLCKAVNSKFRVNTYFYWRKQLCKPNTCGWNCKSTFTKNVILLISQIVFWTDFLCSHYRICMFYIVFVILKQYDHCAPVDAHVEVVPVGMTGRLREFLDSKLMYLVCELEQFYMDIKN
jgi:hypothetical protein